MEFMGRQEWLVGTGLGGFLPSSFCTIVNGEDNLLLNYKPPEKNIRNLQSISINVTTYSAYFRLAISPLWEITNLYQGTLATTFRRSKKQKNTSQLTSLFLPIT